jgi:tellurite resistance protein TehA-like permease
MYLGKVTHAIFANNPDPSIAISGKCIQAVTLMLGLIIWGFGLTWLVFALASIYSAAPFPFNMGWWGFTFPLGVYAASTILIGNELPSVFFSVLGTVSLCVSSIRLESWGIELIISASPRFSLRLLFSYGWLYP